MSNHSQAVLNAKQNANLKTISGQNSTTSINSLKALQTKTFTNGIDPTETLSTATDKQFSVVGGVDLSTSGFSKVNPIRVSDSGVVSSGVLGYTNIADETTATRLSVENGGKLQVQVVGSNDINGGTPHRHLTIDANGRTLVNPLMTSTNSKLDHLSTDLDDIETEVAKTQTSVYTTNVAGISANSGGATYDLGVNFFRLHKLKISGDMIGMTPTNLYIQISSDGSNWSWATGLGFVSVSGGGYGGSFFNTSIDNPMRYWRFYNNDSVSTTNQIDNLWYRVNQN